MGAVYLARQTSLDRLVALKQLELSRTAVGADAERFMQEARLAGSLSHANIDVVYEYFEHEGATFLAMEYLEYGGLRPFVGSLTVAQLAGVFEGVLSGLAYAHARGIVHGDVKPENLLVTAAG